VGQGLAVDLGSASAVRNVVASLRPEVVYHLAALSSVGRSWEEPAATLSANVAGAVNLLEAVRLEVPSARVVWVSSCEVYGAPDVLPVAEDAVLRPANPYAVSKCAGDQLAAVYADAYRLDLLRARPFNHAGPGQQPTFILSSLAQQGARARLDGSARLRVFTGNPATRRDFTDVRDVARAYRLLAERAEPGIYNVSSGRSVSAAEHVALLAELLAPIEVEHVIDPARVRAHEVMDLRGSNQRIRTAIGWEPSIPLVETMRATLEWWEERLGAR
jgi:GDP-4-dehydro-6-deoxy-D-mannose reductase